MSYAEMKAKQQGVAAKPDKAIESYNALRDAYFDAKNKGGKAFYDFIQQHKNDLMGLFDDNQQEKNLIVLVPSIGDEAVGSSDKEWVKEKNAALKNESTLRDAKIAAKEQSIKDVRQRYRPDLAKIEANDAALTERIIAELKQKGYNPTDEDVLKVKNELLKEQERVRRADAYEKKPTWQRIAFALTAPRTAESLSMGLRPTVKDNVLDLVELGSTFLPFGAIAKFPRLFNKIGKAATKLDEFSQGVPVLGIFGDLAKGGGQIAVPEFLASAGVGTADAIAYDDGRERGEKGILEIAGDASKDAVTAALLGHAAGRLAPEKQKILDAADEAIKKQSKLERRLPASQSKGTFIDPRDEMVEDWKKYRTFKEAGDVTDFQPHDVMKNNTAWDEITGDLSSKRLSLSSTTKKQIKDFMDASGLDYIDAIDAMVNGTVKIGTPEEIAFLKKLQKERDKFYYENANKALKNAAIWGPASSALLGGFGNAYGHMTEDRGYEDDE